MTTIHRNPATATQHPYDLIIIGGGIYGVMVAFEAGRRGMRSLLLERDDFGGATSYNSLRIVHGGLRYLQKLDLHRFFESTAERHWIMQMFPDLVEPLPCLMPLYGKGARRPVVMKAALGLNDLLAYDRNDGVRGDRQLGDGYTISAQAVQQRFPLVDTQKLKGGAVWYDGSMPHSQRLLISILRWACNWGATALNYMEAVDVLKEGDRVTGIQARDIDTGEIYEYHGKAVLNSAGPWCREFAAHVDRDVPELFHSSIAWNALFDRPALSDHAIAVAPKKPDARTYFIRPWQGKLLAGTVHDPWLSQVTRLPLPTEQQLQDCITDLNDAIPKLNLTQDEILRIFSGLLPADKPGSADLAVREVIRNHGERNGPQGLYSVSGVKFTTSRLVAEKTVTTIFPRSTYRAGAYPAELKLPQALQGQRGIVPFDWYPAPGDTAWLDECRTIIAEEAVQHLDDLVLRRTSLGDNPDRALALAPTLCKLFPWDEAQSHQEITRLETYLRDRQPVPPKSTQSSPEIPSLVLSS